MIDKITAKLFFQIKMFYKTFKILMIKMLKQKLKINKIIIKMRKIQLLKL
jgi:hypothetical protein